MNKNDELDLLFEKWREDETVEIFVDDGFTDPECYEKQNKHILYVLRDAHIVDKAIKNPSLRKDLRNPIAEGRTWNNVARWTMAWLDEITFDEVERISSAILENQLRRIGFMNLKKEAGGPEAKKISEYAKKHKEKIKEQISICNPDIIVACGTFDEIMCKVYNKDRKDFSVIGDMKYRTGYVEVNGKQIPVVDFYHPKYNKNNRKLFEDMKEIKRIFEEN